MPIYKQTTEITKIDDVWANIDRDIVEVYFGDKNIFTVWGEYTGSLPITINANGDALIDYRIYGANVGAGEPTENLIDANKPNVRQRVEVEPGEKYCLSKYEQFGAYGRPSYAIYDENDNMIASDYISAWMSASFTVPGNGKYVIISFGSSYAGVVSFVKGTAPDYYTPYPANYIPYGYKLPMVTAKNLFNPDGTYEANKFKDNNGNIASYNNAGYYTQYMPINSEEPILVKNARGNYDLTIRLYYYDSQKNWIRRSGGNGYVTDFTETPPAGAAFIQLQLGMPYTTNADKIIISQGGTTTPVYIGENQLGEDEYVSFSDQKIYRNVSGTLTPTDPPVPLPEIPTIDGETVIDYNGEPKPSQMYVKYRKQHS